MIWNLVVPGQPYSWNQSYRVVKLNRRGFNRNEGSFHTIAKTDDAVAYTTLVTTKAREQRPSGWKPPQDGFIVVEFYYFLGRRIDADNVMKLVDDGLATALGVDDRWFLPRAMFSTYGLRPEARRMVLRVGPLEDFASSLPEPLRSTLPQTTSSTS